MNSKNYFADQVAKTIVENHSHCDDEGSFVFGISGKWGEGKTKFLYKLSDKLKDKGFIVVWIDTWKYSTDKYTFLRNFLKQTLEEVKRNPKISVSDNNLAKVQKRIEELNFDISKNRINFDIIKFLGSLFNRNFEWLILFLFIAWYINIFGLINFVLFQKVGKITFSPWYTLVLIPVGLYFFEKLSTVEVSNKNNETLDNFDDILKDICALSDKIVVFVDDLDRVTPQAARDVLDNIRTFFDKPALSYVITGDHSVLERQIGRELLPNSDEAKQLDEGRRFLKKIFNIYWRLPLPPDGEFKTELQKLVDELFKGKNNKNFTDAKGTVEIYLYKYFDKNYRRIKRFIENLNFTFDIIDIQLKDSDITDEMKDQLNEIMDSPTLLVRVLMVQEFCNSAFEKILRNPKLLINLEMTEDLGARDQILSEKFADLTEEQKTFIRSFISEQPKFCENGDVIHNVEPFLYLSIDTSLIDYRGPNEETFIAKLSSGDLSAISNSLALSSVTNRGKNLDKAIENITNQVDVNEKYKLLLFLLQALNQLSEQLGKINFSIAEKLINLNLDFMNNLGDEQQRLTMVETYSSWLDKVHNSDLDESYVVKIGQINLTNIDSLLSKGKQGHFTNRMLIEKLKLAITANPIDGINKLYSFLESNEIDIDTSEIKSLSEAILAQADNENIREPIFNMVGKYFDETDRVKFKGVILEKAQQNEPFLSWVLQKSDTENSIISRKEIENQLIENLKNIGQEDDLLNYLMYLNNKIRLHLQELWITVIQFHIPKFIKILPALSQNELTIIPPTEIAQDLFVKSFQKAEEDVEQIEEFYKYYLPTIWIWRSLGKLFVNKVSKHKGHLDSYPNLKSLIDEWKKREK